jgi:hypothetical protein
MARPPTTRSRFKAVPIETPVDGALQKAVAEAAHLRDNLPFLTCHNCMDEAASTLTEEELLTYAAELIAMQGSWPEALRATPLQKAKAFYRAKKLRG